MSELHHIHVRGGMTVQMLIDLLGGVDEDHPSVRNVSVFTMDEDGNQVPVRNIFLRYEKQSRKVIIS